MRISNSTTTATTNEWPQLIEERVTLMPASHHHQHHPHHRNVSQHLHGATAPGPHSVATAGRATDNQQTLKCPRCDSTNTKFCYYNNYSLSQPRHFCKACKRYWTRGGTLRNVPVGGGCRKNKRIKKTSSTSTSAATAWAVTDPPLYLPPQISNLSLPQSSSNTVDPIFYGLHNNSAVDFSSSFLKSLEQRNLMSSLGPCTDQYDFMNSHPSSLGLCFPMNTTTTTTTAAHQGQGHKTIQFQAPDLAAALAASTAASTSLVHEYSLLGSSLSSSAAASLIAATHRQPKMEATNPPGWPTTYDDVQPDHGTLGFFKESKEEDGSNAVINHNSRLEWQIPCDNIGAVNASPSLYWPNSNAATGIGGGWPESVTNCGSSITPLI